MQILSRAIGILSAALVALGLVLGLVPQTHHFPDDVYSRDDQVACGSPFLPANSAAAAGDAGEDGPSDERRRAEACETVLGDDRAGGISYLALGLLGFAYLGWLRWSGERHGTAEREARWRALGYVPESELDGPPPGWRRATDPGVGPRVGTPVR
jgi:hypothetical protein